MHHLYISPATLRGTAIGLWVLSGLAFLADALLPHAGQFHVFAPWLLAAAVLTTVWLPQGLTTAPLRNQRIFWFVGLVLALAISFTIIRDGTSRSLIFVILTSAVVITLSFPKKSSA